MLTIRQLATKYGLSRASLLYYDKIGLLRPTRRSEAGYRLYGPEDDERLGQICQYRASGLSIEAIAGLLRAAAPNVTAALQRRFQEIHLEVASLRKQQRVIAELLASSVAPPQRQLTKDTWVALLRSNGMTTDDCLRWHQAFERVSPEAHQEFLESLAIAPEEIQAIRARATHQQTIAPSPAPAVARGRRRAPHERTTGV